MTLESFFQAAPELFQNPVFNVGMVLCFLGVSAKVYRISRRYYVTRYCKVTAEELTSLCVGDAVPDRVELVREAMKHLKHPIKTSTANLEEKFQWCLDNVGNLRQVAWHEINSGILFSFKDPELAMTFKLIYGE